MARPKKNQEGPAALERLETAYWKLLENTSQKPTVAAVSKEAQVNHNTFYYYFESIEDMAEKMFQRNISEELVGTILPAILGNNMSEDLFLSIPDAKSKARRMHLMACSPLTSEKLRSYIVSMWMKALGMDFDKFDEADRIKILFLSHGAVGVLRNADSESGMILLSHMFSSPMGQGVIQTVEELRKKYGSHA